MCFFTLKIPLIISVFLIFTIFFAINTNIKENHLHLVDGLKGALIKSQQKLFGVLNRPDIKKVIIALFAMQKMKQL